MKDSLLPTSETKPHASTKLLIQAYSGRVMQLVAVVVVLSLAATLALFCFQTGYIPDSRTDTTKRVSSHTVLTSTLILRESVLQLL